MKMFPDDFMECNIHGASYLLVSMLIECDMAGASRCEISDTGCIVAVPQDCETAVERVIAFSKNLFAGLARVWFLMSDSDKRFFSLFMRELNVYGLRIPGYGIIAGSGDYVLPASVFVEVQPL